MRSRRSRFLTLLGVVTAVGCFNTGSSPTPAPAPIERQVESADATPGFVDVTSEAGIDFTMNFLPNEQGETFKINLYDHGCGVAVGDYNGDGHDDIYLLNQLGGNALFRNKGDGTFEDVTEEMGVALDDRVSVGVTFADYDNDGDQDLFVTSTRGGNTLFRSDDGKFVDATAEAGLEFVGHSQTAIFFDYDNDGWLDMYLLQSAEWTTQSYDEAARYYTGRGDIVEGLAGAWPIEHNHLYHNNGDGTFTEVTEEAGMAGRGWSADAAVFDYNEDGWQDVLVTRMFGRAQLFHNNGDSTFKDVTLDVLGPTPFGGIGVKVFDSNNDGLLDIYIVDMHSDMWTGLDWEHKSLKQAIEFEKLRFDYFFGPQVEGNPDVMQMEMALEDDLDFTHDEVVFGNAFYKNLGGGKFEEISELNSLENFWPWGVATGDYDNDGFVDVFVACGMGYPFYYWRNYLMMNDGRDSFTDASLAHGIEPPAAGRLLPRQIKDQDCPRSSRCAATGDFNGDGRVDLIVNNFNHEPYFYRNQFPQRNYVAFRLTGTKSNRDAIGARVRITSGDQQMTRLVHCASGYLSHSSKTLHFGLGDLTAIDSVEILWPSGQTQTLEGLDINQLHEVTEPGNAE